MGGRANVTRILAPIMRPYLDNIYYQFQKKNGHYLFQIRDTLQPHFNEAFNKDPSVYMPELCMELCRADENRRIIASPQPEILTREWARKRVIKLGNGMTRVLPDESDERDEEDEADLRVFYANMTFAHREVRRYHQTRNKATVIAAQQKEDEWWLPISAIVAKDHDMTFEQAYVKTGLWEPEKKPAKKD